MKACITTYLLSCSQFIQNIFLFHVREMTAFRPGKLGKIIVVCFFISSQIEAKAKLNLTSVISEGLERPVP